MKFEGDPKLPVGFERPDRAVRSSRCAGPRSDYAALSRIRCAAPRARQSCCLEWAGNAAVE